MTPNQVSTLIIFTLAAWTLMPAAPESGAPLRIGPNDGIGPLAVGLSSYPVGAARVTGGAQADLFIEAGRFSEHPGLWLLPWAGVTKNGTPVVGQGRLLAIPGAKPPYDAMTMLEHRRGVYLLLLGKGALIKCFRYAQTGGAGKFVEHSAIALPEMPRGPSQIGAAFNADGSLEIIFTITDGTRYRPKTPDWRSPDYIPFSGTGRWTGGYPWLSFYSVTVRKGLSGGAAENFRRISAEEREILLRGGAPAPLPPGSLGAGETGRSFIAGSWFGDLYFYRDTNQSGPLSLAPKHWLRDPSGVVLRHPSCGAVTAVYPNSAGGLAGIVAGGESAVYFYRAAGRDGGGAPVFAQPTPVLQHATELYAGSLPVPGIVDLDGDGLADLIVGNSEGRLLFFHNQGTPAEPSFAPGLPMFAGGEEILVQPGARGSIQGPSESRWGYLSPTPVDWNGDGLPDIVASSATAEHVVWMNIGTRTQPRLRAAQTLLCNGLELHGTWRVRPAAAKLGGRMAYVALDDDDEVHLYWRLDDRNLEDGGKVRMANGSAISANYLDAGATGRAKLLLSDWDGDGVVDLLIGTTVHSSVPDRKNGLPYSFAGKRGAAVLFLKNTGGNEKLVLAFPALVAHKGKPIFLGSHECAPAVGDIAGEPCLVVGRETGRLYYYKKSELGLIEHIAK
jgi:hypothetical protein